MSTNVSTEPARETLRREHRVRLVTDAEEGAAASDLAAGIYGFTGSPVLASPLFATRRYRNFEVHHLAGGVALIGFVTPADAAQLKKPGGETVTVRVYPDADGDAISIVSIPYERIVQHRQYAVRNAEAISIQVLPAEAALV